MYVLHAAGIAWDEYVLYGLAGLMLGGALWALWRSRRDGASKQKE